MKTKPMLCKGSVVRAMLDGRQTQDRRPISEKVLDAWYEYEEMCVNVGAGVPASMTGMKDFLLERAPYNPGDVIWVRETIKDAGGYCDQRIGKEENYTIIQYLADGYEQRFDGHYNPFGVEKMLCNIPSIHMPKWACRLFLKVNAVRVERITDISWQDACAEGFVDYGDNPSKGHRHDPVGWFHDLWESIYPGTWKRNHWVWVYEFELTDKPADWPTN